MGGRDSYRWVNCMKTWLSPLSCPCSWAKLNSRFISSPLTSTTRKRPAYNSLLTERMETIPKQSVCSKNSLMLSVLPKYMSTCREDNLMLCLRMARSKTSKVPDPRSRSTSGKVASCSGVISSAIGRRLPVRTTTTSSSSRKGV